MELLLHKKFARGEKIRDTDTDMVVVEWTRKREERKGCEERQHVAHHYASKIGMRENPIRKSSEGIEDFNKTAGGRKEQ